MIWVIGKSVPLRFFVQTNIQVLDHPIDSEAKIKLIVDHGLEAIFHLPALRRTFGMTSMASRPSSRLFHKTRLQRGFAIDRQYKSG